MKYLLGLIFTCNLLFSQILTPVTLQLAWKYQFQFAGYIMAKEKGFYEDVGMDVLLKEYEYGMDVQTAMLQGKADFAIGRSTLILDRLEDAHPFSLMFALCQASPVMLQAIKRDDLQNIEDIKGKTFLFSGSGAINRNIASVLSMLHSVGIENKDLNFVQAKKWDASEVTDGTGDVITAYSTITPYHLKKQGFEPLVFHPKDYGFDFYGDILFALESYIQQNPKTAAYFYEATIKGWEYAFSNIDETIDTIKAKYDTQKLDRDLLNFEAKEFMKLAYQPGVSLGDINPLKIEKIVNTYRLLGFAKKNPQNDFNAFIYAPPSSTTLRLSPEEKKYIQERPVVKVGVRKNWKPYDYVNEKGVHVGIAHDLLDIVSQRSGLRFILEQGDDEVLQQKIKKGELDLIALSTILDDNATLNIPSFTLQEYLFKREGIQEENVKTIGVVSSIPGNKTLRTQRLKELHPKAKIQLFTTLENAFDALQTLSIDMVYAPYASALTLLQNKKIKGVEIAFPAQGFKEETLYTMVQSQDKVLGSIVTKVLQTMSEEEKEGIKNQWIPVMVKHEIDWTRIWQVLGFIGVVFMMIMYKHVKLRRLNRQLRKSEEALLEAHQKLKEQAHKDPLTKLYNRRYFEEVAEKLLALSKRNKEPLSMLIVDFDDFKGINDTHGHVTGDLVLTTVSSHFEYMLRKSDMVARYGGEEFIFLLPKTSIDGAQAFSEKLRLMIERLVIVSDKGTPISITISIGMSCLQEESDDFNVLYKKADAALYQAKRSGKNKAIFVA